MNGLRITVNIALSAVLFAAGVYLLSVSAFAVSDRGHPGMDLRFAGTALHLLAGGCFALAAFAAAVVGAWLRGDVALPSAHAVRPHPAYKGELIVRYWYWIAIAVVCFVAAGVQSERVPHGAAVDAHVPISVVSAADS